MANDVHRGQACSIRDRCQSRGEANGTRLPTLQRLPTFQCLRLLSTSRLLYTSPSHILILCTPTSSTLVILLRFRSLSQPSRVETPRPVYARYRLLALLPAIVLPGLYPAFSNDGWVQEEEA
jgi:hypothetical protein